MSDFTFDSLHPDLILDAIESLDVRVSSGLLALNSYENRVYQFVTEQNERYVAKFYRPARWTNDQIQEEHDFALELAEQEVPIAIPSIMRGKTLHEYNGVRFAIFPSVGGRQFEVDNLNQLEWMGRYIGKIHRVAQRKDFVHRPKISLTAYLDEPSKVLVSGQLIPHHLQTAFMTILEQVNATTNTFFNTDYKSIRLHGDLHPGNILWRDGPTFVDLDDCRSGPAVQDLWMMLSGDDQQQFIQMDTLVKAYEEFNDFDRAELNLIEPLRAMRMVHYMAWLTLRWEDPAFPNAFPWFADDKYWENQILALKEQLSSLHEPSIKL